MTFRGTVHNGKIELEHGASLPEGTRVAIQPLKPSPRQKRAKSNGLLRLGTFAVRTGIPDLATQHDHYVYGVPKSRPRRASKR